MMLVKLVSTVNADLERKAKIIIESVSLSKANVEPTLTTHRCFYYKITIMHYIKKQLGRKNY